MSETCLNLYMDEKGDCVRTKCKYCDNLNKNYHGICDSVWDINLDEIKPKDIDRVLNSLKECLKERQHYVDMCVDPRCYDDVHEGAIEKIRKNLQKVEKIKAIETFKDSSKRKLAEFDKKMDIILTKLEDLNEEDLESISKYSSKLKPTTLQVSTTNKTKSLNDYALRNLQIYEESEGPLGYSSILSNPEDGSRLVGFSENNLIEAQNDLIREIKAYTDKEEQKKKKEEEQKKKKEEEQKKKKEQKKKEEEQKKKKEEQKKKGVEKKRKQKK